jgi:phosphinothricin acetyltransferase
MRIREAGENDLPAIVDIYNKGIESRTASTNTRPATVIRSVGWFRQHKTTGRPILVAEEGGSVIGWLSLRPFYRRPAYDATSKVIVYVSPESRRKGVGRELLRSAIENSPSSGVKRMVGYILSINKPAMGLLESSGFQKWGSFPGTASIDGAEHDVVIMGRKM